jgi:hypothetical protein
MALSPCLCLLASQRSTTQPSASLQVASAVAAVRSSSYVARDCSDMSSNAEGSQYFLRDIPELDDFDDRFVFSRGERCHSNRTLYGAALFGLGVGVLAKFTPHGHGAADCIIYAPKHLFEHTSSPKSHNGIFVLFCKSPQHFSQRT